PRLGRGDALVRAARGRVWPRALGSGPAGRRRERGASRRAGRRAGPGVAELLMGRIARTLAFVLLAGLGASARPADEPKAPPAPPPNMLEQLERAICDAV